MLHICQIERSTAQKSSTSRNAYFPWTKIQTQTISITNFKIKESEGEKNINVKHFFVYFVFIPE